MSDKRVTFRVGPMELIGSDGKTMWKHNGQEWYDLPQEGAVFIQGLLVEVEARMTQMGEIVAAGGTPKENVEKAKASGLAPFSGKR